MMYGNFPLASAGDSPGHGVFLFFLRQMPFNNAIPACNIHTPFKKNWVKVPSFQQHLPALFNGHAIQAVKISIVYIHVDCLVVLIFHTEGKYILSFL